MTCSRWFRGGAWCGVAVAAACLSSSPPLPPVRWFDPLPAAAADGGLGEPAAVRVTAAAHLGREFVVRVGPREVALDSQHQWIAEPRQLVATVVARALAGSAARDAALEVALDAFELDVTAAPRAHVRLVLGSARPPGVPGVLDEWAPAADRSPPAFADAMARALVQVEARLRPR